MVILRNLRILPLHFYGLFGCLIAAVCLLFYKEYTPTYAPLLALALVVATMLVLAGPRAVFLSCVAVLPFEATFVIEAGFSVTPAHVAALLLLAAILAHRMRIDWNVGEAKLAIVYLIVCAVSLLNAYLMPLPDLYADSIMSSRASLWRPAVQFGLVLAHLLFFVAAVTLLRSQPNLVAALRIFVMFGALLILLALWQTIAVAYDLPGKDFTFGFGSIEGQTARYGETRFYSGFVADFAPRATFRESLHFSHYLNSVLPLMIALAVYRKRLPQGWRIQVLPLVAVLGAVVMFLTLSRSGWAAFACALLFLGLFLPKRRLAVVSACAIGILLTAVAALQISGYLRDSGTLWELVAIRMDSHYLLQDPRVEQTALLLKTFVAHPFGVGIGNYGIIAAVGLGKTLLISANSVFLLALVENGILGFAFLVALPALFFIRFFRTVFRARDLAAFPFLIGIGATVAATTLQYMTFGDRPGFYYLFILAAGFGLLHTIRSQLETAHSG